MSAYTFSDLMALTDSSYLAHHGILGQKWGKQNGPPYPLDYEDHSAAEKRENSKSSIGGSSAASGHTPKRITSPDPKVRNLENWSARNDAIDKVDFDYKKYGYSDKEWNAFSKSEQQDIKDIADMEDWEHTMNFSSGSESKSTVDKNEYHYRKPTASEDQQIRAAGTDTIAYNSRLVAGAFLGGDRDAMRTLSGKVANRMNSISVHNKTDARYVPASEREIVNRIIQHDDPNIAFSDPMTFVNRYSINDHINEAGEDDDEYWDMFDATNRYAGYQANKKDIRVVESETYKNAKTRKTGR